MLLACAQNDHFAPNFHRACDDAAPRQTECKFEKVSIRQLAGILSEVQRLPALQGFELSFANKTKGGVCVAEAGGSKVHILQGALEDVWPFMVDDSLASGMSNENLLFDLSIPAVSRLRVCEGLDDHERALAEFVMEETRARCVTGVLKK